MRGAVVRPALRERAEEGGGRGGQRWGGVVGGSGGGGGGGGRAGLGGGQVAVGSWPMAARLTSLDSSPPDDPVELPPDGLVQPRITLSRPQGFVVVVVLGGCVVVVVVVVGADGVLVVPLFEGADAAGADGPALVPPPLSAPAICWRPWFMSDCSVVPPL